MAGSRNDSTVVDFLNAEIIYCRLLFLLLILACKSSFVRHSPVQFLVVISGSLEDIPAAIHSSNPSEGHLPSLRNSAVQHFTKRHRKGEKERERDWERTT